MKYLSLFLLGIFILLSGCQKQVSPDQASSLGLETEQSESAGVGEVCGGKEGTPCGTRLECQFDETSVGGEGL